MHALDAYSIMVKHMIHFINQIGWTSLEFKVTPRLQISTTFWEKINLQRSPVNQSTRGPLKVTL